MRTPSSIAADPFPNTRWSLITTAQSGSKEEAKKALSELCQLYWYPVYAYVRRQGNTVHDAEDLTQGFFQAIIRRDWMDRVSQDKGKLRSFMLQTLKDFLVDQHRRATAIKRGGGQELISIDQEEAEAYYQAEPRDDVSPDILFERAWARTLLQDILAKLRASYERANKLPMFESLSPCLLSGETPDYRKLMSELGTTVLALRIQYFRMKERYGELLQQEIRHTVTTEDEAKEEQAFLLAALT